MNHAIESAYVLKRKAKNIIKDGIDDIEGYSYEYELCKHTIDALIWLSMTNRKFRMNKLHKIFENDDLLYEVYDIGYQYSIDVGGIYGCYDVLMGLEKIKDKDGKKLFDCRTKEFKNIKKAISCLDCLRNTGSIFKGGYYNEFNEKQQKELAKIEGL